MEPLATAPRPPGPRPPLAPDDARRLASAAHAQAAIPVEGWSDQSAVEALARRRGRNAAGNASLALEPMAREITVLDLMRHTSGLTYGFTGKSLG